jgi:multidrug efflux pump subunit AcrA (membrane-fusion protein)
MAGRIEEGTTTGRLMKKLKSKTWLLLGIGAAAVAGGAVLWSGPSASTSAVPTFNVQKGPLQIDVLQGGEIRALRNNQVKSEIEAPTKVLSIIPEGYMVTEEDIKEGKVLVELDSSELKTRIQDHEIQFQGTVALYIEADEGREIQKSENQSLVRDMKETGLFALMDFQKYLGRDLSGRILGESHLPKDSDEFAKFVADLENQANTPPAPGEAKADEGKADAKGRPQAKKTAAKEVAERMDFSVFLAGLAGGDGEAQQKLRQLEDDLLLRKSELAVAKQKVEASERLAAKSFISKTQLENDQVNFEKVSLAVKTAETELDLYKKYAFSKQCAQLLSAYRESLTKLQRTVRANRSKMAQAETRFQTAKRRYEMELARREDLERQLKACMIRATQVGLVAYGDLNASSSQRYNESIVEGSSVRFRQTLLTIPDMSQMGVQVNVHESQVKKVRIGQPVLIRVDAEPGKTLEGRVAELAVLPDSSSSRYTPNLKVYPCTIHILGTHPWLKPGMNAKVEIIVDQLASVLYVPVQSIEVENDHHFCYVNNGSKMERREITTGLFNDEFIEIREGLSLGESVALSLPKRATTDDAAKSSGTNPPPAESADPSKPQQAKGKSKNIAAAS